MQKIYFLVLIPIVSIILTPIFANKVTPFILGMPFLLFFCILNVILTSVTLAIIYRFDKVANEEAK